jgi:uncharacterized protein (TIGR03086 family)
LHFCVICLIISTMSTETLSPPLAHLAASLDAAAAVVAGVGPDQWDRPTPCAGWDVATVVAHLRDGTWWFTAALGGPPPDGDPDGRPAAALRRAGEAMLAGFSRPGALDATVSVPLGDVPGTVALQLRATEALVHGWDIAIATGQTLVVDDDVAREALGFSEVALQMIPADRSPFAPPSVVAPDAPPLTRLVALLGRDPAWRA